MLQSLMGKDHGGTGFLWVSCFILLFCVYVDLLMIWADIFCLFFVSCKQSTAFLDGISYKTGKAF
jgi:hypothetical protein